MLYDDPGESLHGYRNEQPGQSFIRTAGLDGYVVLSDWTVILDIDWLEGTIGRCLG